ncbi:MAG: hypothetical protein GY702_18250, partial [Desulfobulbaceae bacterium]|nr:hypothetical protein [Desulfobulbaceae bacterium]
KSEDTFKLYSKMIEHFPNSYIAHYYLGMAYLDQNKLNYAEEEFLKTIELSPKLIEPRLRLIEIYELHDKNQKKINKKIVRTYKKILEIEEHNDFVLMEYALYLHNHGSKKEAELIFLNFGKKSSGDEKYLLKIANEYIVKKRFKAASVVFIEMLKASSKNSSLNFFAGYAFDSLKQYSEAIKYYQMVQPSSAYYKKSIIHTAFLYKEKKELKKSINILEKFNESNPKDTDVIIFLSSFYIETKDLEKSIKLLNHGLSISKDDPDLLFKLGISLDKSGKKDECIKI